VTRKRPFSTSFSPELESKHMANRLLRMVP
jgi:hypothetical protein